MKKLLVSLLLALPLATMACNGEDRKPEELMSAPTFLTQIYDMIIVKDLEEKTSGFLRWSGSLDELNQVIEGCQKVGFDSNQSAKEPIFNTLAEAYTNRRPQDRYFIQIRLNRGITYGQVIAVYNQSRQSLEGRAMFRSMVAPKVFRDAP